MLVGGARILVLPFVHFSSRKEEEIGIPLRYDEGGEQLDREAISDL